MKISPWINDAFIAEHVPAVLMDRLWSEGWRHFGPEFFRYSVVFHDLQPQSIVPLRIVLRDFRESKSQRRVLRQNVDVDWDLRPASVTPEAEALFEKHKQRFTENVPDSLSVFLGKEPERGPCRTLELRASVAGRLFAISYVSLGRTSVSGTYAVFDPADSDRSPGILTLLKEISWAREQGMELYYPGYTTLHPGIYDYKKRFHGLEGYDWEENIWRPWSDFAALQTPEEFL
jgi:arginyl-tRNA--protein-N-Asp/Glu arginylyltransferase